MRSTALFLWLLVAAGQSPSPTGAITGVLLDAATQKPIAGGVVLLSGAPTAAAPADQTTRTTTNAAGDIVSTTMPPPEPFRGLRQITDEQGRFLFINLPPNMSYALTATSYGYYDGAYGRRVTQGNAAQAARRIVLTAGQWFRDARIELTRPASINGRVVDESGEPVVGVIVRTYTDVTVGGVRHAAAGPMTTTDDRGMYRIAGLPAGRYVIAVPSVQHAIPADADLDSAQPQGRARIARTEPEFAIDPTHRLVSLMNSPTPAPSASGRPQVYPFTFYPAARTLTDAAGIQLQSGDERQAIDVQLRPASAFKIGGRLEGPPGISAGMSLRLLPAGSEGLGRGSEVATTVVSGDGAFTFLNVPNGAYTIIANRTTTEYSMRTATPAIATSMPNAPGAIVISMSMGAVDSGPPGTGFTRQASVGDLRHHGRQAVAVNGRDVTGVVVALHPGVAIAGRVVYEFERPPAATAAPVSMRAEPANGDPALGQPTSARNQNPQSLEFRIEGLMSGSYLLRWGGGPGSIKSITWNGRDYTDTPFDASQGQDFTDVIVTMTDAVSVLTGQIQDRQGQPAANSAVIVFPAERTRWTNYGLQPTAIRASTGTTTGTYTLRGLPAGEYFLIAVADDLADRWKDPAFLESASRLAARVTLAWGETKTLPLTRQDIK